MICLAGLSETDEPRRAQSALIRAQADGPVTEATWIIRADGVPGPEAPDIRRAGGESLFYSEPIRFDLNLTLEIQ